jgi:hypothetical protein
MSKRLLLISVILLLAFAGTRAHAQGVGHSRLLTFEGTLLDYSPHSGRSCGVLFVHQVAKYRVVRILAGKYSQPEIVVDHPACDGNVFKSIPVRSRVRITVRVWREYLAVTMHSGIRDIEHPKRFYVAEVPPLIIKVDK